MANQNEMDKIVTPMMEHLCDHLCRFPWETERKEDLEDICAECQMGQYVCDILNTYNRLNDFENTQCAELLRELVTEKSKQQWIPVGERLPDVPIETEDENCPYFNVTFLNGVVNTLQFTSDVCTWFDEDGDVYNDVIAWMPLPEKYQKSDKGDNE